MIKEFQHLKQHLIQTLSETHQQKQLLHKTTSQLEQEKVQMLKNIIKSLSVLDRQIILAQKLPNRDDRTVKLLHEIYEQHRNTLEEILIQAGVTVRPHNASATFKLSTAATPLKTPNNRISSRYFYKKKPLTNEV